MKLRNLTVILTLCWPSLSLAQEVVTLEGKALREYRLYLKKPGFKAFAANGTGAFGYGYDTPDAETADYLAMKSCDASRKHQRMKADGVAECQVLNRATKQ